MAQSLDRNLPAAARKCTHVENEIFIGIEHYCMSTRMSSFNLFRLLVDELSFDWGRQERRKEGFARFEISNNSAFLIGICYWHVL